MRSRIEKTEREMEGMYKRLAKIESTRNQGAIDSANAMYDAESEKLQTLRNTVQA